MMHWGMSNRTIPGWGDEMARSRHLWRCIEGKQLAPVLRTPTIDEWFARCEGLLERLSKETAK